MDSLLVPITAVIMCLFVLATCIEAYVKQKQKQTELTFQIYQDQMAWLKEHKECNAWIKELQDPLGPHYEKYNFSDYLEYFEDLYRLKKRELLDEKLLCDLFGDSLIAVYEANNYELKQTIEKMRTEGRSHCHYEGVEILYNDIKQLNNMKTLSANKKVSPQLTTTVGAGKAVLTLDYPVYSLDRQLLLPAGTTMSEDDLQALVSSSSADSQKKYSLMQFGTVRKDILDFVRQPPGKAVFNNDRELAEVMELMEQVQLAGPKLDSIEYFKQYDSYTYRHMLMVLAYSTLFSKDLIPDYQARIRKVATSLLHDFGKICVPLEILKKESPLTQKERKHLEHHTTAGYILHCYYSQNIDPLAARVARDHHERNDGSGYPRGIRLSDRTVEIVSVCDIYDALTSPRPYRPVAFDNRSALEHITMMAERNEVSWDVVQTLVAHNRRGKPRFTECKVSIEKRGIIPLNNVYGILTA